MSPQNNSKFDLDLGFIAKVFLIKALRDLKIINLDLYDEVAMKLLIGP